MMRKYVIGGLVGFLLAIPFTSFGAEIQAIVGKKVQAEYPVVVDGQQLDKKAIAIDGTTYAPLRSIADATGYDVAFESKTVTFQSQSTEPMGGETVEPTPTTEPVTTSPESSAAPDAVKQLEKEMFQAIAEKSHIAGRNGVDKPLSTEDSNRIKELDALIKDLQTQIDTLKAQP